MDAESAHGDSNLNKANHGADHTTNFNKAHAELEKDAVDESTTILTRPGSLNWARPGRGPGNFESDVGPLATPGEPGAAF